MSHPRSPANVVFVTGGASRVGLSTARLHVLLAKSRISPIPPTQTECFNGIGPLQSLGEWVAGQ
jgi:hypothetical protein